MTEQRIADIKKYTLGRANQRLKEVDYSNPTVAAFQVGKIFGELENNLSKELARERVRTNIIQQKKENIAE